MLMKLTTAYFIAPSAIHQLLDAHERGNYPVLPLEDVYVTGINLDSKQLKRCHFYGLGVITVTHIVTGSIQLARI